MRVTPKRTLFPLFVWYNYSKLDPIFKTYKRPSFEYSVVKTLRSSNMSKRTRHQPGFYASLLDDVHDRGISYKYRSKQTPVVVGPYEVERIVSKRNQEGNVEYFIQ